MKGEGRPHWYLLLGFILLYMLYFSTSMIYVPVNYTYLGAINHIEYVKSYTSEDTKKGYMRLTFTNGTQIDVNSDKVKFVKGESGKDNGSVFLEKRINKYKIYQNVLSEENVSDYNVVIRVNYKANSKISIVKEPSKLLKDYVKLNNTKSGILEQYTNDNSKIENIGIQKSYDTTLGTVVFCVLFLNYLLLEALIASEVYVRFKKKVMKKVFKNGEGTKDKGDRKNRKQK